MNTVERVEIIDVTLREGLQSPPIVDNGMYSVSIPKRLVLFNALDKYRVGRVEVFSPNVGPAERDSLQAIMYERNRLVEQEPERTHPLILAHVRCDEKDVREAIEAGVDGLDMYFGTSPDLQKYSHGKSLDEIARRAYDLLDQIRRKYSTLELRFSGEDAFRTPLEDLFKVYDGISGIVNRFGTPDTVGIAEPDEVYTRVKKLKKQYPKVALEGHFHNDRTFAGINALWAVKAGMEFIDTSLIGLGERSGITSTTGLIFNLHKKDPRYTAGYEISGSYDLNILAARILLNRAQVPPTEPVSLTNRTHFAGVHGKAMVAEGSTAYEANGLEQFGVTEKEILVGPLSGWHTVQYFLTEIENYEVPDAKAIKITKALKGFYSDNPEYFDRDPRQVLRNYAYYFGLKRKVKPDTRLENLSG